MKLHSAFHSRSRLRPERKPLLLLRDALELAQDVVRQQHPRLEYPAEPPPPSLPASELLAELLVEQCANLDALIERYEEVIDHALRAVDDPF